MAHWGLLRQKQKKKYQSKLTSLPTQHGYHSKQLFG
jgi:hypothetical protein